MKDLQLDKYSITKYRYRELKAFCLQYPEKLQELNKIRDVSGVSYDGISVSGGKISQPTEQKAMRAIALQNDIDMVDKCVAVVCEGNEWLFKPLHNNITKNISFEDIFEIPYSRRSFFRARRKFFWLLDSLKDGTN